MSVTTCTECGCETVWTDRICSGCKQDTTPELTAHDLFVASLPAQAHSIRRVGR